MWQPEDFGGITHPRYLTLASLGLCMMFSGLYMITTLTVIGHCYYEPCYEGGGIVYVWKVNSSISWPAMVFGLSLLASSAWGWHHLRTKNVTEDSAGILTGASLWSLVAAFCNCCTWGTQNIIMNELALDHPTQSESGRTMKVNKALDSAFVGLTVYSSFTFILYTFVVYNLLFKRQQMLGMPGGDGAAYGSDYTPFGDSQNALPPAKSGLSEEGTGYNDL